MRAAPNLGQAGVERPESWDWAPALEATVDSGEGRLRKPSQGPHASSALGRVLRPRPGLRSFGENSDPSGTGSKGPCTTPGPSPHSEIGPWAESTPPAPTTPSLHGTSTQLRVERCSTLLPGAPSPSPWKTTPPPASHQPPGLSQPGRGEAREEGEAQLPGFGQRIWPFGDLFGVFSHHVVLAEEE